MGFLRPHLRRLFGVALASLWLATLACAGAAVTPAMHCQGMHMPCCPPSGSDNAQCAPVACAPPAFQKAEARTLPQPFLLHRRNAQQEPGQPSPQQLRAFAAVPLFRASVFRLKDDLRI